MLLAHCAGSFQMDSIPSERLCFVGSLLRHTSKEALCV